jgi:hypothetical protein
MVSLSSGVTCVIVAHAHSHGIKSNTMMDL